LDNNLFSHTAVTKLIYTSMLLCSCMKTITLRDEVYDNLVRLKQNNESFSDVIKDLLERKITNIEPFFGALKDNPVLDEIEKYAKDSRRRARVRT